MGGGGSAQVVLPNAGIVSPECLQLDPEGARPFFVTVLPAPILQFTDTNKVHEGIHWVFLRFNGPPKGAGLITG